MVVRSFAGRPPERSGGHRLKAVGETWWELASKVAAAACSEDVCKHLAPVQFGVGSRSACETIIHACRQRMWRICSDDRRALAKLGLPNYFNTTDRSAVVAAAPRYAPGIVPWCDFADRRPCNLALGSSEVESARGVQKGGPLGAAFVPSALLGCILRASAATRSRFPDGIHVVVVCLHDETMPGSEILRLPSEQNSVFNSAASGVPWALPDHRVLMGLFVSLIGSGNFDLLGVPFGLSEHCAAHTSSKVVTAGELLEAVSSMQHA